MQMISGFSKLSKLEKINVIVDECFHASGSVKDQIIKFWHSDQKLQETLDEFSENTITNFYFPYGVVPNVMINGKNHIVPMVIEESSVVAACSKAAKFWSTRGGFNAQVISTIKSGQVHFVWKGEVEKLFKFFNEKKEELILETKPLCANMEKRGGGLIDVELLDKSDLEENYYQLNAKFETCDAMGANFINSVLECLGKKIRDLAFENDKFNEEERDLQVIMCILSNYTPECLVKAWVECPVEELLDPKHEMSAEEFAWKFSRAVKIAKIDKYRATTHNKGIFNGVDAVVLATGNDFRAVEACGHTHACRDGQYRSLTNCSVVDGKFRFEIELPLALGTVGGLTSLHPMAKMSLDMMGRPSAKELMEITAVIGLAQNFGALRSLVTSGIQKGHMKMHLMNILNHLEATQKERDLVIEEFSDKVVSFNAVRELIEGLRNLQ